VTQGGISSKNLQTIFFTCRALFIKFVLGIFCSEYREGKW
jgi:hypothetical protein